MFPKIESNYQPRFNYPDVLYSPEGVLHRYMTISPLDDDAWYSPEGKTAHYGLTYNQAMKQGFTKAAPTP